MPNFGQYDFQKSIFSPCGMNGYEHDLGREKTNLDVFYTILNFFFASEDRNMKITPIKRFMLDPVYKDS